MLSMDRDNFAFACNRELLKATELTGAFDRMSPDQEHKAKARLEQIAKDMAEQLPTSIPVSAVPKLFGVARANYARVPNLNDIQKAWDNHVKPRADAPLPCDKPALLPPPSLSRSEANLRKLAAVRTCIAEGGQIGMMSLVRDAKSDFIRHLQVDEWMYDALADDPSIDEVRAMMAATTDGSLGFYLRCPSVPPCWGHWIMYYNLHNGETK